MALAGPIPAQSRVAAGARTIKKAPHARESARRANAQVYDGRRALDSAKLYATAASGRAAPADVVGSSGVLLVAFTSDATVGAAGFTATWSVGTAAATPPLLTTVAPTGAPTGAPSAAAGGGCADQQVSVRARRDWVRVHWDPSLHVAREPNVHPPGIDDASTPLRFERAAACLVTPAH